MKKTLTIAGSDSGAGAGIQADLKTFAAFGIYGTSVITALTAQNTKGVEGILNIPPSFVEKQIDTVMSDIKPQTWKTGMLVNDEIIEVVFHKVKEYQIKNLIIDPVMIAKGGDYLLSEDAIVHLIKNLLPLSLVVTPNCHEAEVLTGIKIQTVSDMKQSATVLYKMGAKNIIIKGGHLPDHMEAIDVFYDGNKFYEMHSKRIKTNNTHGTGCTFASAVAAGIAKGYSVLYAVRNAKKYIDKSIRSAIYMQIGKGHGPLNHFPMNKIVNSEKLKIDSNMF